MNGARTGKGLTPVPSPLRDEVLLSGADWNALSIDNQRVAALYNDKVFVIIMHMRVDTADSRQVQKAI